MVGRYKGSFVRTLQALYPNYNWNLQKFAGLHHKWRQKTPMSKVQYLLFQHVKQMFPEFLTESNYKFSFDSNGSCELDVSLCLFYSLTFLIFIPNLALAFEYNGEHHYRSVSMYPTLQDCILLNRFEVLEKVQQNDQVKRQICDNNGITLLVIPYWWDKTKESLAQTLHAVRPDISLPAALLKGDVISSIVPKATDDKGSSENFNV